MIAYLSPSYCTTYQMYEFSQSVCDEKKINNKNKIQASVLVKIRGLCNNKLCGYLLDLTTFQRLDIMLFMII